MADIGIRLAEGINDLKIDQQLDSTRDAIQRTLNAGSTNFFRAVEGVRGRWMQRANSSPNTDIGTTGYLSKADTLQPETNSVKSAQSAEASGSRAPSVEGSPQPPPALPKGMRPLSLASHNPPLPASIPDPRPTVNSWGSSIGSFFTQRAPRFSGGKTQPTPDVSAHPGVASPMPSMTSMQSKLGSITVATDNGSEELQPRNLDEVHVGPTVKLPPGSVSKRSSMQGSVDSVDTASTGFAL
jgi:hypothetical protein